MFCFLSFETKRKFPSFFSLQRPNRELCQGTHGNSGHTDLIMTQGCLSSCWMSEGVAKYNVAKQMSLDAICTHNRLLAVYIITIKTHREALYLNRCQQFVWKIKKKKKKKCAISETKKSKRKVFNNECYQKTKSCVKNYVYIL